jgi:hypothetical protein
VNDGIAVAGQGRLVVLTIFDAEEQSFGAIAADARRLADVCAKAPSVPRVLGRELHRVQPPVRTG